MAIQRDVVHTTRQTYKQAAQVLARAFVDDPVTIASFPKFSAERRIAALTVDFSDELICCIRKGIPLQVNEDGKVIGCAVIYPPGAYPLSAFDQWMLLIKSFVGNGFYDIRSWMAWLDEVDKIRPSEPHYYLEYLGVEPDKQGKAVGSALMQTLARLSDEAQVGCYLENANPRNVVFYQRFGFQVMQSKEIINIPSWFMWRPPQGK
jgi:ribosomal protein S18 acetylase RimI-like enzyme